MNLFIVAFLYLGTAIGIIKVTMSAASAITKVMIQNILGTHTQDNTTLLGSGSDNKAKSSEAPKLDPNEMVAKQQEAVSSEQEKGYMGENFDAGRIRVDGQIDLKGSIAVDKNIGTAADVNILNADYLNQDGQNVENLISERQKIKISGPMELGTTFNNDEINGGKRFTLALGSPNINNLNTPQDSTLGLNVNNLNAELNVQGKNVNSLNAPEGSTLNVQGKNVNSLNVPEGSTLNEQGANVNSLNAPEGSTLNEQGTNVNTINVPTEPALDEADSHVNKLNNLKEITLNVHRLDRNFDDDVRKQIDLNPDIRLRSGNRRKIRPPERDLLVGRGNRFFAKGNVYHYLGRGGNFDVYGHMPKVLKYKHFSDLRTSAFGSGLSMKEYAKLMEFRKELMKNESIGVQSSSETGLQERATMVPDDTIHNLNDPEFRQMMRTMLESNPDVDPKSLANMIMMAQKLLEKRKPIAQNYVNQAITSGNENMSQPTERRIRTVEKQDDIEEKEKRHMSKEAARQEARKYVSESSGSAINTGTRLKIAASTLLLEKKNVLQQDDKSAINEKLNSITGSQNITKEEKKKLRKELTNGAIDAKLAAQGVLVQRAIERDPEGTKQILGEDLFEKVLQRLQKLNKKKNKRERRTNVINNVNTAQAHNAYANLENNNVNASSKDLTKISDLNNNDINSYLRTVDINALIKRMRDNDKNKRVEGNNHNV